jgi:hypothetical protein
VNEEDKNLHESLNIEQFASYKTIMSTFGSPNHGVFFIDVPGGTGKTFLYRRFLEQYDLKIRLLLLQLRPVSLLLLCLVDEPHIPALRYH